MFKRIILEDWYYIVPIACLAAVGIIFTLGVIYAIRMKQPKADYLANLPLQGDDKLEGKSDEKIENE